MERKTFFLVNFILMLIVIPTVLHFAYSGRTNVNTNEKIGVTSRLFRRPFGWTRDGTKVRSPLILSEFPVINNLNDCQMSRS